MSDPLATNLLGLPYLAAAQAQKHVTHNEALRMLDALVQVGVIDRTVTDPPGAPAEGDRYIVAATATGTWAGHEDEIAAYVDGVWAFFTPLAGWLAFDAASNTLLLFDGAARLAVGDFLGAVSQFGVNAIADATNRLAVGSNAVLFTAVEAGEGGTGDVRFLVNKEADGDTASLLFQSGYSARAEVGLVGDTDSVFKVSANGADWVEAIRIDKDTGLPAILYDNATSGLTAATVQAAIDEVAAAGGGGGAVDSVFGRTGAVVAAASDYDASQVDNDSGVSGAEVSDALDTLGAAIPADSDDIANVSDVAGASVSDALDALGASIGRKNLLHNGGFQVAQRGDGPFTSSGSGNADDSYQLDGCIFLANGSDTCDISRVADGDFESGYAIELDVETANRRFGILLPLEAAVCKKVIKSGKASFQFKAKRAGASLANVRAYLLAWSGTADAITSDCISAWGSAGGNPTFAANWTAENAGANSVVGTSVATFTFEDIDVDTASVKQLALLIISDPTTTTITDALRIGDIQLEEGQRCTGYEHRHVGEDLALCQRYYQAVVFTGQDYGFALRSSGGAGRHWTGTLSPQMRVDPTADTSGLTFSSDSFGASSFKAKRFWFRNTNVLAESTLEYVSGTLTLSAEL